MRIIFITGGSGSGKSTYALREASKWAGKKAYIATAEHIDDEMTERIENHIKERDKTWDTYEEPAKLPDIILKLNEEYKTIIVDCLTIWLSNIIINNSGFSKEQIEKEINKLINALSDCKHSNNSSSSIYIVSNEVGMGIVPENKLGRLFRDMTGRLNQMVAEIASEVYLLISGIPIKVKGND